MPGYSNKMTNVLNKIEGRLGLRYIPMPEDYTKDKWADRIIIPDSLTTFSRYYQRKITYHVGPDNPKKDGWFYIDESKLGGPDVEVLGILDLDWFSLTNRIHTQGYGYVDVFSETGLYTPESMLVSQVNADYSSLFDSGIYIETEDPNKFRLVSSINQSLNGLIPDFDLYVLIKHSPDLTTISPTMMETFEELCMCDVALYLYNELKYIDGLETTYAQLDLKLDDLRDWATKRNDVIDRLDEYHVSATNAVQPMIITV